MSKAAPRIYVYSEFTRSVTKGCPTDVGYVREDIVDELVDVINKYLAINVLDQLDDVDIEAWAALAKLEESHD